MDIEHIALLPQFQVRRQSQQNQIEEKPAKASAESSIRLSLKPPQTFNKISAQFQCEPKSKHPFNGGGGVGGGGNPPSPTTHLLLGGHMRSSPSFLLAGAPSQLFFRFLPNFFAAAPSFSAFPP